MGFTGMPNSQDFINLWLVKKNVVLVGSLVGVGAGFLL